MQSMLVLTGQNLDLQHFASVVRRNRPVGLDPTARARLLASREALEAMLAQGDVIYGVNTGFGGNVKFLIPSKQVVCHQQGMLRHLCCGTGPMLPSEAVRGAMLLRANALANGFSAVRPVIVDRLLQMLNADIVPLVPRYGSVGASGDLVPSAYIASGLLGEGTVASGGQELSVRRALDEHGIEPVELQPKEGLALVNGTTVMTSVAALALQNATDLARLCVAAVAMSTEALKATVDPFEPEIHALKNHPGQMEVAAMLRRFTAGSTLTSSLELVRRGIRQRFDQGSTEIEEVDPIQTPYSLRCAPQGLGPVFESLQFAKTVVEREMNSVNDNPLVDAHEHRVYHTGNFYGGHIARAMDGMKIDLANMANWSHGLMAMLVDPRFSNGLPANLVENPGLHSGFKGMQLCQTSLVVACRQMAGASLIHTLPTEQYNQDVVSLGLHSALTAWDMTALLRDAMAILILALCQGLDLRKQAHPGLKLGAGTSSIWSTVRAEVPYLDADRAMHDDIHRVGQLIQRQAIELQ